MLIVCTCSDRDDDDGDDDELRASWPTERLQVDLNVNYEWRFLLNGDTEQLYYGAPLIVACLCLPDSVTFAQRIAIGH
jgi:hypothetical protein